jgi:hypothetical protein
LSSKTHQEKKMKAFSLFLLVAALGMGTASVLRIGQLQHLVNPNAAASAQSSDGAFRDGLYLGRLAAERGAEPHLAIGRWAFPEDRASFTAGYQQGYSEFLASGRRSE